MMKLLKIILAVLLLTSPIYASETTTNYNLVIPSIGDRDWGPVLSRDIISIDSILKMVSSDTTQIGIISSDVGVLKIKVTVISSDVGTLKTNDTTKTLQISILSSDVGVLKILTTNILSPDVQALKTNTAIISSDVGVAKTALTNRVSQDAVLTTLTVNTTAIIPNGANPTVSATGQIAIDTSAASGDAIRYYGDAQYVLPAYQSKSIVVIAPDVSSDMSVWLVPYDITIRKIRLFCKDGTSIIGGLLECDNTGSNCVSVDTALLSANANTIAADDGSLSNPGISAGNILSWDTGTTTGSVNYELVTYEYTIDAVN